MSNYTEKRLRDYMERFNMMDEFIDKIEALPDPSQELQDAIVVLKLMRTGIRYEAVRYLEAPYRPPPVEDDP